MAVMAWIESEVARAIKRGAEHLEWVTPSGFHCYTETEQETC